MDKERAGIQSVEVGFALLEGLTRSRGPLMLKDVAASAGMSAAKAHRYLVSFQRLGLVTQDPRNARYDLGPAALKLGLASLARLDAVRLARERMPELMEAIGHTLALAVWGNHGPTIVHWEESPQAVTANLRLGDVMPLLSSATGSWASPRWAPLPPSTPSGAAPSTRRCARLRPSSPVIWARAAPDGPGTQVDATARALSHHSPGAGPALAGSERRAAGLGQPRVACRQSVPHAQHCGPAATRCRCGSCGSRCPRGGETCGRAQAARAPQTTGTGNTPAPGRPGATPRVPLHRGHRPQHGGRCRRRAGRPRRSCLDRC